MDEQQRRITEDLNGVFRGRISCDSLTLSVYSSDASLYQIKPLGVAFPRDANDVSTLAQYSQEQDIPLVARGAGSGVVGGAIGKGIIVDFSRYMRHIESIGSETVTVQPGVVLNDLNRELKKQGRYFAPDPSGANVTTIGGMIATDAAGSHAIRVGSTRDHVLSIDTVLAGGIQETFGAESLDILKAPPESGDQSNLNVKRNILSRLNGLLVENRDLIREKQPLDLRNCCGYSLRGVLRNDKLLLPRLLIGSEGTLGLFTSAVLHTSLLPEYRGIVIVLFGQTESAFKCVKSITLQQPSACDLLDRRLLSLARDANKKFSKMISPSAEAALIIEHTGLSEKEVKERIANTVTSIHDIDSKAIVAAEGYTPEEVDFLWSLPARVVPRLAQLKGESRPLPFVEGIAVHPENVHEFLMQSQKVLQKHQITASLYAHVASGQLHIRPFLPLPTVNTSSQLEDISRDLYQLVFSMNGTISGEHGDGLARTAFIRSQYGPLYKAFQQIKDIFDPHNLMNPGKIISDDARITVRNLRPHPQQIPEPVTEVVSLQLQWKPEILSQEAGSCNGCADCKTVEHFHRMCPFFRINHSEESSPRSKANLFRSYFSGELKPDEVSSQEAMRLADLCFNCKQCELECPSKVNIPQMVLELKANYVRSNGLSKTNWLLSRAHSFGNLGSSFSMLSNWMISNPLARWGMQKLIGIAQQRKLPRYAKRSFIKQVDKKHLVPPKLSDNKKTVVYFVGDYANYHDPELAKAFMAIMEKQGIHVYIPPKQLGSAMAMISAGDLETAKEVAEQNIRELSDVAREGFPIICTEPTVALCLKQEYPMITDHPDVQTVADQVIEAGDYLQKLHLKNELSLDFRPINHNTGYHTPCHLKALGKGRPLFQLLSLIPELKVNTIDKGCSGMAGAYGLSQQNFRSSIRIGWGLISEMRTSDYNFGITECCSCKIQMEQGTTKPTVNPLKLLALSYGLMPEIENKLKPNLERLIVS